MFEACLSNKEYLTNLETNAMKFIEGERKKLTIVYEVIESYIKDNSLIISQPEFLYEDVFNLAELNSIIIFGENIFRHSTKLINKISEALELHESKLPDIETQNPLAIDCNARWLILRTVVAHEEINIFYDGRPMVIFKAINRYKTLDVFKLLLPAKSNTGFFTKSQLLLLPPELELMDVYHKLYSPDKAEDWENLIRMEFHLYEKFAQRKKEIIGGKEDCSRTIVTNIENIKKLIVLDFLKNQPAVLIGDWAVKLMEFGDTGKVFSDTYEKVQIIVDSHIEEFNEVLENFLKTLTPYKATFREEKLHIISDSRLKKYTFYINGSCSMSGQKFEKPFLDVFNSGTYELVPYRISGEFSSSKEFPTDVKVASAHVLLRFLLIDIWILRVIKNLGLLTPAILETKITKLFQIIADIKNARKFNNLISKFGQHDNYLGRYQSLFIYQKNKLLDAKFPPYTPYYWKKANGAYRDV